MDGSYHTVEIAAFADVEWVAHFKVCADKIWAHLLDRSKSSSDDTRWSNNKGIYITFFPCLQDTARRDVGQLRRSK